MSTTCARRLNERGILIAGYGGKGGVWVSPGPWSRQAVLQMLRNPTYMGKYTRSGIVVPCPAIIDEETWQAVQRVTKQSRQQHTGRPSKNQYLLRMFLWCKKCTRRCITNPGRRVHGTHCPYYRCGNIEYKPFRRRCSAPGVPAAIIEAVAWNAIWGLLKDPALLLQLGRAYYEGLPKPEGNGAEALEHEAARLTQRIKTTRQMMRDSAIDYADGLAGIRQDEKRVRQIEEELAAAGRVVSLPPLRAAEAAMREITTGPEPKRYERRRNILEGILDLRMTYFDDDLQIEGKVPVPDAETSAGSGKKKCNTGIRADAQGQRKHRRGGEPGTAQEHTSGIPHVVVQIEQPPGNPCIPHFLLYLTDATELDEGSPSSFAIVEAGRYQVIGTALHVISEFSVEVAFHATPPELEQIEKLPQGSFALIEDQADSRNGRTLPKPSTDRL
jgi:hypothetical protein